jgi:membrane protein CcdC involved in cytochrome C biogenesis
MSHSARSTHSGNTKGGSITLLLTSCLTGLDLSVLTIKTKIVSCHSDSKPVKQEDNFTVILPPLLFRRIIYTYLHATQGGGMQLSINYAMN